MADITLTVTLPDTHVPTAVARFLAIYPNEEITEDDDGNQDLIYPTTKLWAEEILKRDLRAILKAGAIKIANESFSNDSEDMVT